MNIDQLVEIFRHLNLSEVLHACSSNNQWRRFCQQDDLWQKYFKKDLEAVAVEILQRHQFQDALILSTLNPTFKELFDQTSLWRKAIPDLSELIDLPWDQFLAVSKLAPFFNLPDYWQESLKKRYRGYKEDRSLRWNLAMFINENRIYRDRRLIEKLTTQIPLFRRHAQDPLFWREVINYIYPVLEEVEEIPDIREFFFHEITWYSPDDEYPDEKRRLLEWLQKKADQEKGEAAAYYLIDEEDPMQYHRIFICTSLASFIRQLFITYPDMASDFQEFYQYRYNEVAYQELVARLTNPSSDYQVAIYPLTYESPL